MLVFSWDERFLTGVPVIDEQHQGLVCMVNELASALSGGVAPDFQRLFKRLADYAHIHFSTEENLMACNDVPAATQAAHRQAHARFVAELRALHVDVEADAEHAGETLIHFLITWLTFHILGEDRKLARCLLTGGDDVDPEAGDGGREALLLDALEWLFKILAARNQALRDAGLELARVEAKLKLNSDDFESRVRARTDELFAVNEALEHDCLELKKLVHKLESQGR